MREAKNFDDLSGPLAAQCLVVFLISFHALTLTSYPSPPLYMYNSTYAAQSPFESSSPSLSDLPTRTFVSTFEYSVLPRLIRPKPIVGLVRHRHRHLYTYITTHHSL
ncbi:hypothetical protein F5X99DRAFT_395241 [Biscogniauxia marginata]|nr:hypothetical protein F5X99DRAFT_395241 [Biscogniauxia marginata]